MNKNKWKWCTSVCCFCGLIILVCGIVIPFTLIDFIRSEAERSIVMTDSNYELWGQVPGKTNSTLYRDFTFYNFENPYEVLFRNKKPEFHESDVYSYIELQNFTNYKFEDNGNEVSFTWFVQTVPNNQKEEDIMQFANFIAIGAWYQMKNTEPASMALQGFAAYYFEMKKFLYVTMISQVIRPTLLTEKQAKETFLKEFPTILKDRIWADNEFGMDNSTAFINWVVAVRDGVKSGSAADLKNYFGLSFNQLNLIITSLAPLQQTATQIIANLFCSETEDRKCTDKFLCAKQWATQEITLDPNGGNPLPSVVTGNLTSHVYPKNTDLDRFPELNFFYTDYFLKKVDNSQEYQNLKFDIKWAQEFLNHADYTLENPIYLKDKHILMNIGNMRALYELGSAYDKTKDNQYITQIKDRFKTESKEHARVLWEYIKYMEQEFAVQQSSKGTKGIAALGTVASQSLFAEFMNMKDNLLDILIAKILLLNGNFCATLINTVDEISPEQARAFCAREELKQWDLNSMRQLIHLCDNENGHYWDELAKALNLKAVQLIQFCDADGQGFGVYFQRANDLIKQQYQCQYAKCSKLELAIKQWSKSQISLNPIKDLEEKLNVKAKDTLNEQFPEFFTKKFELSWFWKTYPDASPSPIVELTYERARYLMSYDCLLNGVMVSNAFIYELNDDIAEYTLWFTFNSFKFNNYLRYLMLEVGLDGFADKRQVKEILFGYWPSIVDAIKNMDPAMGGDPSSAIAGLNLNIPEEKSQKQTMYTGKSDTKLVRIYKSIDASDYLTATIPYFDGYEITTKTFNPWLIKEACNLGTDALSFAPDLAKKDVNTIIPDLFRNARLNYSKNTEFYGLSTYRFDVDKKLLLPDPQYDSKIQGLINFTKVQNAPVYNSLTHFYSADPKLETYITVKNRDGNIQTANDYDTSYVIVEPISGAVVAAWLNLQVNVELSADILFKDVNYAMLPVMSLKRGGNWTEATVDDQFGDLKTGLTLVPYIRWVPISLGIFTILCSLGFFYWKVYRNKDDNKNLNIQQTFLQTIVSDNQQS